MKGKKTVKWTILIILLALVLALASSTMAAPPTQEPDSIACGDSITCSTAGNAVYVENAGTGPTIYGHNTSTGDGLKGRGNPGVYGFSYFAAGIRGKSNKGIGVKGESVDKYGVAGYSQNSSGGYLRGASNSHPDLVLGANSGTEDDGTIYSEPSDADSDILLYSMDRVHIHLDQDDNSADSDFRILSGSDTVLATIDEGGHLELYSSLDVGGGFSHGSIRAGHTPDADLWLNANGDIYAELDNNSDETGRCFRIRDGANSTIWSACESKGVTTAGSAATAVETGSGSREMYAVSSPENWFEDFGSGQLVDGQATISLDPLFAETVNLESEYHVYLTPMGDCNGLYVTNQTAGSFEVRELGGGTSGTEFHYRIVARRLGYEGQRLEPVPPAPAEEVDS